MIYEKGIFQVRSVNDNVFMTTLHFCAVQKQDLRKSWKKQKKRENHGIKVINNINKQKYLYYTE